MASLTEHTPKTLSEFIEIIEDLQNVAEHPLWFRGAGQATHKLLPSLYRHPSANHATDFHQLERNIMNRFRQRGLPYHDRDLSDNWDALFFMQHYGVPTRLLDWTENPFIALHFALMTSPCEISKGGKRTHKSAAAVWVIDPFTWNKRSLEHISYNGGPLAQWDDPMKGFSPDPNNFVNNAFPVAMYGSHNSTRIVAQQGVFTIFGKDRTPMETLVRNGTFPSNALMRISITPARIEPLRRSLLAQGITESTVFPDLEGLAKETKRHFGFEG